jgi:hypothetical protein
VSHGCGNPRLVIGMPLQLLTFAYAVPQASASLIRYNLHLETLDAFSLLQNMIEAPSARVGH